MKTTVVKGAARLRRKLRRMPEEITADVVREIRAGAGAVLREAQRRVPVSEWDRTREQGHLRDALEASFTLKGLRARVGLLGRNKGDYFYAAFLEWGTRKMGKRPFLFPSWMSHRDRIRKNVKEAAEEAIDRVSTMPLSDGPLV